MCNFMIYKYIINVYCSKNNEITVAFKTTIDKLKELDYEFPMSS